MNSDELSKKVLVQSPRIIYLSGKTCTGKTTFADYLQQYGYEKVELDQIVTRSVVIPFSVPPGDGFRTAYRDEGPKEQVDAFISAARAEILQKLSGGPLVIEGAIAQSRILKETRLFQEFATANPLDVDTWRKTLNRLKHYLSDFWLLYKSSPNLQKALEVPMLVPSHKST